MKKLTKLLILALTVILMFACSACGAKTPEDGGGNGGNTDIETPGGNGGGDDTENPPASTDIKYTPRAKQTMPTAEVVDKDYDYGAESTWAGESYTSVDLGSVYLQDVVDDTVYDWGHSVIKEGDTYKMWWVRPAVYDAVFYAESKDLKNWTNVKRVLSLSPNSTNVTKYDNIKGMLGKPSVIHVGDKYYMYFEAPAAEDPDITHEVLEWDNQVMLATSSDGISWEYYCGDGNQPQPVVAMPSTLMGSFNNKHYGAGQPSVFYKDNTFYLTYCYVLYGSAPEAGIWLATSTDGINFGDRSTHVRISDSNGLGFTYNTLTGKYMRCTPTRIYESNTTDFTNQSVTTGGNVYYTYDGTKSVTSFAEFVKNPHGLIDTPTMYMIHMQGVRSTTSDWRNEHTTWDGHIHAVNPAEYANRTITLPNGGAATESNLAQYRDRSNLYEQLDAKAIYAATDAIAVDGVKEDIYDKASKVTIARSVYNYGSNFTDSWAEAWIAWNEDYLYVFAQVYDNNVDNSYPIATTKAAYMRDSFDIFVDPVNDHVGTNVAYGLDQYVISVGSNNSDFIIKGSGEDDITSLFKSPRHRVTLTDYGYALEVRVPWNELSVDFIEENALIGLDFQINDCMGGKVGREAIVCWNDHTGNAFRYVDVMGDVLLAKE